MRQLFRRDAVSRKKCLTLFYYIKNETMINRLLTILLGLIALMAVSHTASAGDKENPLEFVETSHDFGTIKASDGRVSHEYEFTNVSSQPVVILMMTNGGCGCTTPEYPRKPIAPGEKSKVKITFDPTGRRGEFNREVRVRYQAGKQKTKRSLTFSGAIIP